MEIGESRRSLTPAEKSEKTAEYPPYQAQNPMKIAAAYGKTLTQIC